MDKHYPVPAKDAVSTDRDAIDHALNKWAGALPENLKKHGLTHPPWRENFHLAFSNTCSLCIRATDCNDCLVKRICGDDCVEILNPYDMEGDAEPAFMLLLLMREILQDKCGKDK